MRSQAHTAQKAERRRDGHKTKRAGKPKQKTGRLHCFANMCHRQVDGKEEIGFPRGDIVLSVFLARPSPGFIDQRQ